MSQPLFISSPDSSISASTSSTSTSTSTSSLLVNVTENRLLMDQCKLCFELTKIDHRTINNLYATSPQTRQLFVVETKLCDCAPTSTRYHVLCLGLWLKLTADRPCPNCHRLFQSPTHITRHDSFARIFFNYYFDNWMLFALFLNLWLIKIRIIDQYPFDITDMVADVPDGSYLLYLVPFFNIFLLNYFHLLYRCQRYYYGIIEFSYSHLRMSATQMYTADMVALRYVRSNHRPRWVNYGQLHDKCSYCGHDVIYKPHMRYVCRCFAIHYCCFRHKMQKCRKNPNLYGNKELPENSLRCCNCGEMFQVPNYAHLIILCIRDTLYYRNWNSLQCLQYYSADMFQYRPTFMQYLFTFQNGLNRLLLFTIAILFFIYVELNLPINSNLLCFFWQHTSHICPSSNWNPNVTLMEIPIWSTYHHGQLLLQVLWFSYEFYCQLYQQFVQQFIIQKDHWKSQIIFRDYKNFYIVSE